MRIGHKKIHSRSHTLGSTAVKNKPGTVTYNVSAFAFVDDDMSTTSHEILNEWLITFWVWGIIWVWENNHQIWVWEVVESW